MWMAAVQSECSQFLVGFNAQVRSLETTLRDCVIVEHDTAKPTTTKGATPSSDEDQDEDEDEGEGDVDRALDEAWEKLPPMATLSVRASSSPPRSIAKAREAAAAMKKSESESESESDSEEEEEEEEEEGDAMVGCVGVGG